MLEIIYFGVLQSIFDIRIRVLNGHRFYLVIVLMLNFHFLKINYTIRYGKSPEFGFIDDHFF